MSKKSTDNPALASKGRMGAQAPKVADCALQFLFSNHGIHVLVGQVCGQGLRDNDFACQDAQ